MTANEVTLRHLLDIWDREIIAPPSIEHIIAELELAYADTMVERLRLATQTDLGDIPKCLAASSGLSVEGNLHLARRLGWTLKMLTEWDPQQDRSGLQLEAALVSVAAWNVDGGFWQAVQSRLQGCRFTIAALEIVLGNRALQVHIPDNTPVWEREHLHAMQEAERAFNWADLGERARAFALLPSPDIAAQQATLALALLDWPRLVRLASQRESWLHSYFLIAPLPLVDALRLATASGNGYVRFAALERVAYREVRDLWPQEETALRDLLIVLAHDANDWPIWLTLCNCYPIRHPHMQTALGRALARLDDDAIRAYVDSISLDTSDPGMRLNVTHCLSAFRSQANVVRRLVLWRAAFERWNAWDFSSANDQQMLTAVARSALDYGVVGWFVEGEQRMSLIDLEGHFEQELHALDLRWHASLSAMISKFYHLVSRHQVMAHAAERSKDDEDWLPGSEVYVPAIVADPYIQRRFRWNEGAS